MRYNLADIHAIADAHSLDYDVLAIRVQDVPFAPGKITHCSKVWVDGEETGEELDGVCATRIDMIDSANKRGYYYGDHLAVIGGYYYEYGEDIGEVIISNAEVIEIIS